MASEKVTGSDGPMTEKHSESPISSTARVSFTISQADTNTRFLSRLAESILPHSGTEIESNVVSRELGLPWQEVKIAISTVLKLVNNFV